MKKLLFFAIALSFAIASCTNDALNEVVEEPTVPESTAAPVLYASFESNEIESKAGFTYDGAGHYDHYWNAGDHIYVFPKEDVYDIYECTDASKGVFTLLKDRTGSATAVDKIYALYNSELADNGNVIDEGYANMWTATPPFIATPISWNYTVNGPDKNGAYGYQNIMAAAIDDSGEKLVFKSTVGWLRLQLKGTQKVKSIMITSMFGNIFPISMSEVYVTNMAGTPSFEYEDGLNGNQRKLSISAPYAQLNTTTATDFYITLPPCTMSKGFQLTIEYADGTSQDISTSVQEYQIKRNIVTKLPERTVGTTISNLSSSGTANTYIVQSAGNKKFDATVKGSSSESVGTPVRAAVLWESYNNTTTPTVGDIVTNVTYLNGYVYFRAPFTNTGNAVIAVYDSSDNILWSWLIWVTDISGLTTPEDLSYFVSGFQVMKYPIGAMGVSDRGLYYQWGRKDPFYFNVTNIYGTNVAATNSQTASKSTSSISGSISHPTTYYFPSNYHWGPTDNTSLWSDAEKTMYDPCPPGWKVISSDKMGAAISKSFCSGANGTSAFNPFVAIGLDAGGNFVSITGENGYWTSKARLGGVGLVTSKLKVDGITLTINDESGTVYGYPVRCEKM